MRIHRAAIIACLPLFACTGTETGNGFTQEIRVGAHSSNPANFAVAIADGGGVVAEAWVIVGAMTFVADGDCGAGGEGVAAVALGADDHAGGPIDLMVELNEGDFCQVTVPLGGPASIPTSAPPQLSPTNAIVLLGQTAAGTDFTIVGEAPVVQLVAPAPFALSEDSDLFIGFDVAEWLTGLDIDGGDVTAGRVLIDANNNTTLSAVFNDNVAGGVAVYRDEDGDGEADPGEPRLALGQ